MSYQDEANLAQDVLFNQRLAAGLASEAKTRGTEGGADLPAMILRNPADGARIFMPTIASSPGFGAQYAMDGQEGITDGMLLSAIQANWTLVEEIYFPPTVPVA